VRSLEKEIQIEWGHCDPARVVFNPRYFEWIDAADMQLVTSCFDAVQDTANPRFAGIPLLANKANFKAPARYGETIILHSRVVKVGAAVITMSHVFARDDMVLVECEETRAWTIADPDNEGELKAHPIPESVRARLVADVSL
jgi:4-hydroxybenzoyl-CoA thioesterase